MMAKILSDLHGVGIKLKTTQIRFFKNAINIQIMLESLTEDGQFQVLFTLYLMLLSAGKYRFNQIQPMTPLMDNLDKCTRLSRKIITSGDTC